jgi:hypothetical protein
MGQEKKDNLVQLNARVPQSLRDSFWDTVPKGTNKQHVMAAVARLWISLPVEYQKMLIDAESSGKAISQSSLVEIVRQIVEDRIQEGRRAGKSLLELQRKKQGQKD